ncbi:MAG: hypothetical protein KDC28_18200 [Saprospiraceae bacterium]|nr:hypothetical protein [Saprospiraceae bacterium]MCB9317994.1 hypothetical protein [Lewinellaceae bacterium]
MHGVTATSLACHVLQAGECENIAQFKIIHYHYNPESRSSKITLVKPTRFTIMLQRCLYPKFILLTAVIWCGLPLASFAQLPQAEGKPDVLRWLDLAEKNISFQDDSAVFYLDMVQNYLTSHPDSILSHQLAYKKSRTYLSQGHAEEALQSIRTAMEFVTPLRDTATLALYTKQEAKTLFYLQDYSKAFELTLRSDSLYSHLATPFSNWENAKIRADIYRVHQQFDQAESELNESLQRATRYDSRMNVGFILWHKIQLASITNNPEKQAAAIEAYLDYIGTDKILDRVKPFHMGSLFDSEPAPLIIRRIERILPYYESKHNYPAMLIMLENLADLYQETHQYARAANSAKKALELSDNFYQAKSDFLGQLYEIHKAAGQPGQALLYLEQWKRLDDSILQVENRTRIQELQIRYQTAQKEQEIYQLVTQNQIKDLTIAKALRNDWILGIGLLSAIMLITLLYGLNRNRRQTATTLADTNAELAASLQERELLLKEIHHRVKNNLQVISSLLYLQSQHTSDTHAIQALNEGRNRVQSMGLIHQNLYQDGHLTGVNIKTYIEKLIASLMDSYQVKPNRISWSTELPDKTVRIDTMIPLALVINELISNAIKHGFPGDRAGRIEIRLFENPGQGWTLEVQDNGVGIPENFDPATADGLGMELVKMFSKRLGARFAYRKADGTLFTLLLPNLDLL